MQVKKAGGKVYGAVLTAAEKKAMDLEIQRELAEYDRKHIAEIDATILWVLHEQFGFGAQRLRTYYDAFHDRIKELVSRYEMEDQDDYLALHSDAEENRRRCGGVAQGE